MKFAKAWNESPGLILLLIGWLCLFLAIAFSMIGVRSPSEFCSFAAPTSWLTGLVCGLCIRQNAYGKVANWRNGLSILLIGFSIYLISRLIAYGAV